MLNHRGVMECRRGMPMQPAAPPARVMSYQCLCGKTWHPNSLMNGAHQWICSCGATLALRNGVIFAPAVEPGEVPASGDRIQRWVARGGG